MRKLKACDPFQSRESSLNTRHPTVIKQHLSITSTKAFFVTMKRTETCRQDQLVTITRLTYTKPSTQFDIKLVARKAPNVATNIVASTRQLGNPPATKVEASNI